MRVILFLSRFTFICNIAFLLFVFFRWLEVRKPVRATGDNVFEIPFIKELIITLGIMAIFINLIIIIIYVIFSFSDKLKMIPSWLVVTNVLFFAAQFCYFFLF